MRTSTRGRQCAVVGGWVAVVSVVGCASGGARAGGVGPGVSPEVAANVAALNARRLRGAADDSVQVGYGVMGRRRMTGSVSSVSGDAARTQHMLRIEELLQRVPGVVVSPRGDGSYSVRIRGATTLNAYSTADPLVVVDGLPVAGGTGVLNTIAPEDVDRIDVLKDAEASIYGSRSANGVILVRTRHMKPSQN